MGRDPRDMVENYGQYMSPEDKASLKENEKEFKKAEKARKKEEKRQEKLAWKTASKSERRSSGQRDIVIGLGIFAIGLVITIATIVASSSTGFYFLAWGAIGYGVFSLARGIWRVTTNMGDDQSTR